MPLETDEARALCDKIKVRDPGCRSFTLAGLLAVLLCGVVVTAVDLLLPPPSSLG